MILLSDRRHQGAPLVRVQTPVRLGRADFDLTTGQLALLIACLSLVEAYMVVKRPTAAILLPAALAGGAMLTLPGIGFVVAVAMTIALPQGIPHVWLAIPAVALCGGLTWRPLSRIDVLFLGWAAWMFASWRFSPDISKHTILSWAVAVSLYAFARYTVATLPRIQAVLLGAGTVAAAATIYEWAVQRVIFGDPAKYQWASRAYGAPFRAGSIFGGAPAASIAIALIMLACLPLFRSRRRRLVAGCYGILLLAEVGTYSRAGWIGLIVGAGVFYATRPKRHWGRLVYAFAAVGLLVALAWPKLTATNTYQQGIIRSESTSVRQTFLREAWPLVADSPSHLLVGRGFNALVAPPHPDPNLARATDVLNRGGTHDTYMTMLLEQGLVGLLFFAAWLVLSLRAGMRLARSSLDVAAVTAALAALASAALFHDVMHADETVSVVALIAGLATRVISSAERSKVA